MKKLLMAIAAIAIASQVHAAAIQWSLTSITSSDANAAKAGMVAYFMDASTYNDFTALTADKVAAYAVANNTYTGATTANARTGAISLNVTSGSYNPGDSISGYVVLFDTADAASASYYVASSVVSASIAASGANKAMDFGTVASNGGWTTTAVPEPTSGLLLLLGMAGLALKRKRA